MGDLDSYAGNRGASREEGTLQWELAWHRESRVEAEKGIPGKGTGPGEGELWDVPGTVGFLHHCGKLK